MAYSQEDYKSAMEVVATMEKELISSVREVLVAVKDQLADARGQLEAIAATLPASSGPVSAPRSNITSWLGQLTSFEQQTLYMTQSADSVLAQYNAAATGTTPAPAPSTQP